MSILDDLPDLIADAVGELLFKEATLKGIGGRVSDGQGGTIPSISSHDCLALIVDYSDFSRLANGIPAKDRKALILAATLAVIPKPDDVLVIDAKGWVLVSISSDPANATYEAQCRSAPIPA